MEDDQLTWKSHIFIGGYYFAVIFLTACIMYDILVTEDITGFTFGFIFALFYFIARLRDARQLVEDLKSNN